jgi:hypothetical protein
MNHALIRRGKSEHRYTKVRRPHDNGGRDWNDAATAKQTPEGKERHGTYSPSTPKQGSNTTLTPQVRRLASKPVRKEISLV